MPSPEQENTAPPSPDVTKPNLFEVFVVTGEPLSKIQAVMTALNDSRCDRFSAHVLSGAETSGDNYSTPAAVAVHHFPGESVFHLRARIPALAGNCDWVLILEDHNHMQSDWPDRVAAALDRVDRKTSILIGAATNDQSTDAWSYANFLSVLGFHWAPVISRPLEALGFNVALRRAVLGKERLRLGQYETQTMPEALRSAQADGSFAVDHVQYRAFPEVLHYHWCNGRVTGSFMRKYDARGLRKALSHARNTSFRRQRRLRGVLSKHPRRHELPKNSLLRLQLLAIMHSLGCLWGGLFGEGQAPWELE